MATSVILGNSSLHNATAVSSSYTYGDTVTITVTADPGYIFTTSNPPKIGYTNIQFSYRESTFSLSDDRKTGTVSVNTRIIFVEGSGDGKHVYIDVIGNPEQSTAEIYTVTKNFTHCSSTIPNSIEENTQFNWSIFADDKYEFKDGSVTSNIGEVHFNAEYPNSVNVVGTATGNITITATATEIPVIVTHTVTKTLTNCTGDIPSTIQDGSQFTWTLTPNEGYEFKDGSVTSNVGTVSITSTGATITGTATGDITITATATEIVKTVNIITGTVENCSYTPKTANYGDTVTITITSDSGYAFTTNTPYIEYTDTDYDQSQHNFTLNSDKTSGTVSVDTNDLEEDSLKIEVYATATAIPVIVTHTVTKTLTNCTGDIPSTIQDGSQFTWTLTPNEGYEFKDGSVTSNVGTVSITSTGATITGTATGNITIQATATAIPVIVTYTVTKTLTNCTGDIPSTIQDGSQFTWTLTPSEGYEFKDGSVTSNVGTVSITLTGATITGTATGNITIQATATEIVKTVNIITGTVENCSYTPKTANYGDTVTITITSDSGYAFTTQTPYIEYTDTDYSQEQLKFKLNSDKTSGTVTVDTHDVNDTKLKIEVYATATYQQGTTVNEMYTVYSVSPSDLQAISNKRFVNVSGSDAYNEQLITYINDLYRLPLTFEDLPTQALMLKNETVVSSAHVIPNVTYAYDMGTVTLPKKHSNSNDYNNVYDVMLPYYGVYTLDNAKALDTAINIHAVIDIISGSCTYIFSRDGHAIDSVKTNVKENLPYMTRDMQQTGSLTTVTQFEVEPSITCYYHDITNAYVNKDVNDTVSNLTYFKADSIIHCSGISNKYKNLILNKLREGVFTNEL